MSLSSRLLEALTDQGHLPAHLAKACGVSRATVSAWLDGTTKEVKAIHIANAARFLKVSSVWLATGRGSKKPDPSEAALSPDQDQLLTLYGQLSDEKKAAFIEFMKAMVEGK